MDFTYLETAMAFFGLASIVIGSFADRLTEHILREPQTERPRRQSQQLMTKCRWCRTLTPLP
jgi:hypothetical protein